MRWSRQLTVKLSGRAMAPDWRRERTISAALATQQVSPHGPLQRLLEGERWIISILRQPKCQ